MIQLRTILVSADNSGAKKMRVIGVPGFSKRHSAGIGDIIKASVLQATPTGQVKKGDKVNVLVVRTKKEIRRKDGSYVRFSDNAGVLINKTGALLGSRVFGPIPHEIKQSGYEQVVSLAKEVV